MNGWWRWCCRHFFLMETLRPPRPKELSVEPPACILGQVFEDVRQVESIETFAGMGPEYRAYGGDGGDPRQAKFDRPHGICVAPDGAVYIGDTNNNRVRVVQ